MSRNIGIFGWAHGVLAVVLAVLVLAPSAWAEALPPGFSSEPTSTGFGFVSFNGMFGSDLQAGSHPRETTTEFELPLSGEVGNELTTGGVLRELAVDLPPGFVGDPDATAQCTRQQFDLGTGSVTNSTTCPAASVVGEISLRLGSSALRTRIYNMVPPAGMPAQFALDISGYETFFDFSVRTGGDYGITVRAVNIPPGVSFSNVVIFGEPAGATRPLLTLPTACEGPQPVTAEASTWEEQNQVARTKYITHDSTNTPAGFTGCQRLSFLPSVTAAPDTGAADTPAGLTVDVKMPEGGLSEENGLSMSDVKGTTVTLPEGVVINPGQAVGLAACQETEAQSAIGTENAPQCPSASKVGEVEIETPLLKQNLRGDVYVMQSNPPELHLLLAVSGSGLNFKFVGVVHLDEHTGRLVTTFGEQPEVETKDPFLKGHLRLPELPFTDFKVSFSGGARAALATPSRCATYTTGSDFTPWSTPYIPDAFPASSFQVASGPGGSACPAGLLPFTPELIAGATTDQAGGFTDFSMLLRRPDDQQRIDGLQFKAPEGLTGFLSRVPLCTNAQAETDTCPAASKIGHTVVESGPGPYPLVVPEPGQEPAPIYLTESYGGAPFGLSIVVPLHVGPFTLATQRVRAKIEVNPITSALTVTTNPLPQEVAGIPTDLREVDAVIERPEFMVNPTNCDPQEFTGTAYGTPPPGQNEPNTTATIASHFQVGSCRSLQFTPQFAVSASGDTSKADGASLTAKVSYPNVPQGTDADIASVKVELPEQLPSRLTTLQKACVAKQFEANPAGCPAASFIGHAMVHTPLLPVPLEGPAIFVSHGGEAFPSLTIVLQGDGVTVDVVGATFISKAGITSTTFKTVPDAPFSVFELTLPQGPYSALTANGDLCAPTKTVTVKKKQTIKIKGHRKTVTRSIQKTEPEALRMPNEFIAQNSARIHQSTTITVTDCPKTIIKHAKQKTKAKQKQAKHVQGKH